MSSDSKLLDEDIKEETRVIMRPKKPPRPKSEMFLNKHDPHPRRKRFSAFGVSVHYGLAALILMFIYFHFFCGPLAKFCNQVTFHSHLFFCNVFFKQPNERRRLLQKKWIRHSLIYAFIYVVMFFIYFYLCNKRTECTMRFRMSKWIWNG